MKKIFSLVFCVGLTAMQNCLAYTYTVKNGFPNSGIRVTVFVEGLVVQPSQTKEFAPLETKKFEFTGAQKGLCFSHIEVNGKTVRAITNKLKTYTVAEVYNEINKTYNDPHYKSELFKSKLESGFETAATDIISFGIVEPAVRCRSMGFLIVANPHTSEIMAILVSGL